MLPEPPSPFQVGLAAGDSSLGPSFLLHKQEEGEPDSMVGCADHGMASGHPSKDVHYPGQEGNSEPHTRGAMGRPHRRTHGPQVTMATESSGASNPKPQTPDPNLMAPSPAPLYPNPMSQVEILRIGPEMLPVYSQVSIAFEVRSELRVEVVECGLGGLRMTEEPVTPYVKGYDLGEYHPAAWPKHWPIANWCFLLARAGGVPVGGATVAIDSPGLHMTERYPDSANLWDLRVAPDWRGKRVGSRLVLEAEAFALEHGFRKMHVETQNVNVNACRFYRSQGFRLFAMDTRAYAADLPNESMLLWGKDLG
jgi:ribosomal protein S18 acetylase RimI-like enzyme